MRRILSAAVILALMLPTYSGAAPRAQGQTASLSGTATSSTGQTLANTTVQLRNLVTGQIMGTSTSTAAGGFSFGGLPAGTYAVEIVSPVGQVLGSTASISVTAGATVTGVSVSSTLAAAGGGAGGAAAGAASGIGGGGGLGTTAIVTITTIAAGAGIAGAVAIAKNDASPSR